MARCIRTMKNGQQCKKDAVIGSTVCNKHGAGNPHIGRPGGRPPTTYRYVTRVPAKLREKLIESLTDSELLNMREDIALIDARNFELLGQIDIGETGALWRQAKAAYAVLEDAMQEGDAKKTNAAFHDLGVLLNRGVGIWAGWAELFGNVEQRRKLVESESRRLEKMQLMITAEDADRLLSAVMESVERNVKSSGLPQDKAERVIRTIFGDSARLLSRADASARQSLGERPID